MSAISSVCSTNLNVNIDNSKIETSLGSIFTKNDIPVNLFLVRKDSNFNEDVQLFLKVYPGFGQARQKYFNDGFEYLAYFFGNLKKGLESGERAYIRAYMNNKLVGCAAYDIKWKIDQPNWEKCIYVDHIFIDPEYQKSGIGKGLLFSIFKEVQIAAKFDSMAALVEWYPIHNPTKFYQALEFKYVENPGFSVKGSIYKWIKK